MKIYSSVCIDMGSGHILHEEYEDYEGGLALCGGGGKGGGGGGSTTVNSSSTPDYAYNSRMAAVAERQQNLSDQFFNWWEKMQAPVEQANAQAQLGLIPLQTSLAREGMEGFKGIQGDFYNASKPTSAETYAGRAVADTNMAISNAQGQLARNMGRMGVNPNSGASLAANRDLAVQSAAQLAGAANTGRMQGEDANLKKLSNAMQFGLGG